MKKQRTSLFRILILSLVMLVTVFIIGIAWFAPQNEATASGLTIKSSSGLGLDSSFNGVDYGTFIKRERTNKFKFPLITGNGKDGMFFIPALERSSGTPLDATTLKPTSSGTNWLSKRPAVAARYDVDKEGDYYVEDIWFRSSSELDLYLSTSSYVKALEGDKAPSEWVRKSDFGEFTKDYIAGAARVSFSKIEGTGNSEIETPLFVWAPNETYQLFTGDDMTPIKSTTPSGGESSFNPHNPDETFGLTDTSKYTPVEKYFNEVLYDKNNNSNVISSQSKKMYKVNNTTDTYIVAISLVATDYVDHGILITDEDHSGSTFPTGYDSINFTASASKDGTKLEDTFENFGYISAFFDGTTNVAGGNLPKLSVTCQLSPNSFFGTNDRFQLLIEYSPKKSLTRGQNFEIVGFVYYNSKTNQSITDSSTWEYNGAAGIGPGDSIVQPYYSMENGSTVVITNNTTSTSQTTYALNANTASASAVRLEMVSKTVDSNTYIAPGSPLASMMYTVSKLDNGGYTLKSLTTGKYLAISDRKIALSDTASEFTLSVGNGGPMLRSGEYYLSFSNGQFGVSNTSDNATLQIYQGTSYSFTTDGSEEDVYQYYDKTAKALTPLEVKLTSQLDDSSLLRLASAGTSGDGTPIYSAHIRIRIWAEGTDREAKIPLAGGIFTTHLEFQGVPVPETT